MTKSELAKAAEVSERTLRRWLNTPYMRKKLRRFKLKDRQRILPPAAVKIICDHYVIKTD